MRMSLEYLAIIVIAVLVIGGGWFVVRNFTKSPAMVVDQSSMKMAAVPESATKSKSGSFIKVDPFHKGSGEAAVYQTEEGPVLSLENFSVTPGPDLFVYLSKNTGLKGTFADVGEFVSLGKLKHSKGDQLYALPENYAEYGSVVIWCRAFGVHFSSADLK